MNPRDLLERLDAARQQAAKAAAYTVSLAKPAAGAAGSGLGFVTRHAAGSGLGFVKRHAAGAAGSGLGFVKHHAAAVVPSTREGAVKTAAVAPAATMKAPGAAGFLISRAASVANPQVYFHILRTAGAAAAAAAAYAVPVVL